VVCALDATCTNRDIRPANTLRMPTIYEYMHIYAAYIHTRIHTRSQHSRAHSCVHIHTHMCRGSAPHL
jgi:hypothetical protein